MLELPTKHPDEKLDYALDFTDRLGNYTIASVDASSAVERDTGLAAPAGFLVSSPPPSPAGKTVVFWLEGGDAGEDYLIEIKITDSADREHVGQATVAVREEL